MNSIIQRSKDLSTLLTKKALTIFKRRSNASELTETFRSIRHSEQQLIPEKTKIESKFLQIGTALEDIVENSSKLVEACRNISDLKSGEHGSEQIVQDSNATIEPTFKYLDSSKRELEKVSDRLSHCNDDIDKILSIDKQLQHALDPLKYVQTLFRVECSQFSQEVQEMFVSLVAEISRIEDVFKELMPKFLSIGQTVNEVSSTISQRSEKQRKTLQSKRDRIQKVIDSVTSDIADNDLLTTDLSDHSVLINQHGGNVVIALQCQDMVNQKLEHIDQALEQIGDHIKCFSKKSTGEQAGVSIDFIHKASQIVSAQYAAVQNDLQNAENEIGTNVDSILKSVLVFENLAESSSQANDFTAMLEEAMIEVNSLLLEMESYTTVISDSIAPILPPMLEIADTLSDLSLEIQLIGLNSQVNAAHIGSGSGLEVLSARTSDISSEASGLSRLVVKEIKEAAKRLNESTDSLDQLRKDCEQPKEIFEEAAKHLKTQIQSHRNARNSYFYEIEVSVENLKRFSKNIADLSCVDSSTTSKIKILKNEVNELADKALSLKSKSKHTANSDELVSQFLSGYTMASERDIHLSTTNDSSSSSDTPQDEVQDDLLFFDDFSDRSNSPANTEKKDEAIESLDLWD